MAKSLLEKLKQERLVLNWRKRQTTRAMVFTTVQEILDKLPRMYTPELYEQKCELVYQHFYESYPRQRQSIYSQLLAGLIRLRLVARRLFSPPYADTGSYIPRSTYGPLWDRPNLACS